MLRIEQVLRPYGGGGGGNVAVQSGFAILIFLLSSTNVMAYGNHGDYFNQDVVFRDQFCGSDNTHLFCHKNRGARAIQL